jgi:hypothetical protein
VVVEMIEKLVEFGLNESRPKPLDKVTTHTKCKIIIVYTRLREDSEDALMGWVGFNINFRPCLPECFDIVTPLKPKTQPATFNCNVMNTFQEAVCRKFLC